MTKCPYSYFEYKPISGETYASLAKRFHIEERALRDMNSGARVSASIPLRVPCRMGGCGRGAFYTLSKGDTLRAVAKKNGVSMDALLAANPYLNPAYYIPGQVIVIPQEAPENAVSAYTLGDDEGVFDVLRKFDMDLNTFAAINPHLDVMNIYGGVRVSVIRNQNSGGAPRWYAVQQGDTAEKIAKKLGVTLARLLAANENVRPGEYTPGMRIRIPVRQSNRIRIHREYADVTAEDA